MQQVTSTPIHYLEVYQCPFNKVRYGNKRDGGYAICETDVKYDVLLSAGISTDISFENDFLKLYDIPCYGFDGTIKNIPQRQYATDKIQWVCKNVGTSNSDTETNLIEYIEKYNNIVLKMDIEGGEYPFFQLLTQEHLKKISQITIELHELTGYKNINGDKIYTMDMFTELNITHTLLHAHGNNNILTPTKTSDGYSVPSLLELTFVRTTDILKQFPEYVKILNTIPYPQQCDYPNKIDREEVPLNYYPFLDVKHS